MRNLLIRCLSIASLDVRLQPFDLRAHSTALWDVTPAAVTNFNIHVLYQFWIVRLTYRNTLSQVPRFVCDGQPIKLLFTYGAFIYRWTVDRLDLELENRQWTFYVNPQSPASVTQGAVSQFKDDLDEADGQVSSTTRRKNSIQSQELLYINTKSHGSWFFSS